MIKTSETTNGVADGLPTALDVAQAKSKYDPNPATTAAWEYLRGKTRHAPPEILRDGRVVLAGTKTVQAVLYDMGLDLFTAEDVAKAHDMEAWMLASIKASEAYSLSNVNAYQHRQRDAIEAKLAAGESTGDMVIESRETINRTFLAHLHAGENARKRKTDTEIRPFCKPILEKFWAALETHMAALEAQDRLESVAFDLPYSPRLLWQACYSIACAYNPSTRLQSGAPWNRPSDIFAGLLTF